jgi:hypothetical protein
MLRTTQNSFASSFAKRPERSPNGGGPRPPNTDNLAMASLITQEVIDLRATTKLEQQTTSAQESASRLSRINLHRRA